MINFNRIADIIGKKYKINATWLYKMPEADRSNMALLEIRIKEVFCDYLPFKDRNSVARCLTITYMNHVYGNVPRKDFVSLTEFKNKYCKYKLKISTIRNLLTSQGYLLDNLPTMKSYRANRVFTKFRNDCEIIMLWKLSFLHSIVENYASEYNAAINQYRYLPPKNKRHCLSRISDSILNLSQENPELNINLRCHYIETLDYLLSIKMPTCRAANQLDDLVRDILFIHRENIFNR